MTNNITEISSITSLKVLDGKPNTDCIMGYGFDLHSAAKFCLHEVCASDYVVTSAVLMALP